MRRAWMFSAALLAACGTSTGAVEPDIESVPTPVPTVARVGSLPATIPATSPPATEPLVVITRPVNSDGEEAELIGDQVGGNRLLMIGDSIFAGTETRYGGEMCAGLEPLGWAVEVAAEAGRFVEFGVTVADRNVPDSDSDSDADSEESREPASSDGDLEPAGPDDWDAAAVFLGSNYNGNQDNYDSEMRKILDRLAPRPTLLYTVTEFRTNYSEVNEVIDGLVADYSNVTLIDWSEAAETPGVLRSDGLHPNDAGEQVLVDLTAAALGDAPEGEADCIRSRFRDDSAIEDGSGSPNTSSSSSSSGGSSSSSSGRSSSSSSGSSSSSSSSGGSSGSGSGSSTSGSTNGSGGTTDGGTDSTDGGGTDSTDGGVTDGGGTDGGVTDGGGTDGGGTDGGGTDGTATDGTATDGSATDGSATAGTATAGGTTAGGTTGSETSGTTGSTTGTDGSSSTTVPASGSDTGGTDGSGSDTGLP